MMTVILVIIIISGGTQSIPLQTKAACERAAEKINADGRRYGMGYYAYCIEQI
jgi:hypothetical protein